jgi:hypothetical protein
MPNCWRCDLYLAYFLEVSKTQDLPSKIWQTLEDALVIEQGQNRLLTVH